MTLGEIEAILGKPTQFGRLALAVGPKIDGRIHVNLAEPVYSDGHFAKWYCMLPLDNSIPPGTREAVGRYCLAVEDERGDWSMSGACEQHSATMHD